MADKMLYSFDVFDTLITRTTLTPDGIFLSVRDKMLASELNYPHALVAKYRSARSKAEYDCRAALREADGSEIAFDAIFERLASSYELSVQQAASLKLWELEAEYDASRPIPENIQRVHELVDAGEDVVLISDMYLPEDVIKLLLAKHDALLAELPLYLSSTYACQKLDGGLFACARDKRAHKTYEHWKHTGDMRYVDYVMPKRLGIDAELYSPATQLSDAISNMAASLESFEAQCIARVLAEKLKDIHSPEERFVIEYAAPLILPYVMWLVDDAHTHGIPELCFIMRDGYHLKRIADSIIKARDLPISTKLIYGSRKAWRLASQLSQVDTKLFTLAGNFGELDSFNALLEAAYLDEDSFLRLFPEHAELSRQKPFRFSDCAAFTQALAEYEPYHSYLLKKAAEVRPSVLTYLRQELNPKVERAFVDAWGSGYTQDCLSRLLGEAFSVPASSQFYYFCCELPNSECNRRYTLIEWQEKPPYFLEALLTNLPVRSCEGYETNDSLVTPICPSNPMCVPQIYTALETMLPPIAAQIAQLNINTSAQSMAALVQYELDTFAKHKLDPLFLSCVAPLPWESAYGNSREYAPSLHGEDLLRRLQRLPFRTCSEEMSLTRTTFPLRTAWQLLRTLGH